MKNLPGILGILILFFEVYRLLRKYWIRRILKRKKKAKRLRKPLMMQPKSERDCPFCEKKREKSDQKGEKCQWHGVSRKVVGARRSENQPRVTSAQAQLSDLGCRNYTLA